MSQDRKASRSLDYTRHYRHWHDETDEHFDLQAGHFGRVLGPLLPQRKDAAILEIGSGMGFALGGLQRLGYTNVRGIDADLGQVAAARRRQLPCEHVPVERTLQVLGDYANSLDFVFAFDVLEHVPCAEQVEFLAAIEEALRPGGAFFCQVPNANSFMAGRFRYIDWTHTSSFTEHSLDFALYNAGFADIRVFETDLMSRPRLWFIPRRSVARWLLHRLFRSLRRLQYALEIGEAEAARIPLTANIRALARKANEPNL